MRLLCGITLESGINSCNFPCYIDESQYKIGCKTHFVYYSGGSACEASSKPVFACWGVRAKVWTIAN